MSIINEIHLIFLQEVLFFPAMKPDDPNKHKEAADENSAMSNHQPEK